MADMIFRNHPDFGDFTVKDEWPQWQKDMWLMALGMPPKPPSFAPTYEEGHTVVSIGSGGETSSIKLNPQYFATEETAKEMMKRFSAAGIAEVPYIRDLHGNANPGPTVSSAKERWLVFADGIAYNAGLLASHFTRNPENQFPNVAENAVWHDIAGARAAGQRLLSKKTASPDVTAPARRIAAARPRFSKKKSPKAK